jgi:hypothetical protein
MRVLLVASTCLVAIAACSSSSGTSNGGTNPPPNDGAVTPDGGAVTVIAEGRSHPHALALRNATLYWIEQDAAGSLMKVSTDGGTPSAVTTGCAALALAVDDARAYCNGLDKSVRAIAIGSGSVETVATSQPVSAIAVDANNVYWTTYYGLRANGANYTTQVLSVPITGGAMTQHAIEQPLASSLAVDDAGVVFLTFSQADPTTASAGTWVMTAAFGITTPFALAKDDATAPYSQGSEALAMDATHVYWCADGFVRNAPRAGGAVQTIASLTDATVEAIAIDDASVYFTFFTNAGATGISKVSKSGGDATPVITGEIATQLAVDATSVYWTNESTGRISKAPK